MRRRRQMWVWVWMKAVDGTPGRRPGPGPGWGGRCVGCTGCRARTTRWPRLAPWPGAAAASSPTAGACLSFSLCVCACFHICVCVLVFVCSHPTLCHVTVHVHRTHLDPPSLTLSPTSLSPFQRHAATDPVGVPHAAYIALVERAARYLLIPPGLLHALVDQVHATPPGARNAFPFVPSSLRPFVEALSILADSSLMIRVCGCVS